MKGKVTYYKREALSKREVLKNIGRKRDRKLQSCSTVVLIEVGLIEGAPIKEGK